MPLQKVCSVMTNVRMYHNIVINYLFTCSQYTQSLGRASYKAHMSLVREECREKTKNVKSLV